MKHFLTLAMAMVLFTSTAFGFDQQVLVTVGDDSAIRTNNNSAFQPSIYGSNTGTNSKAAGVFGYSGYGHGVEGVAAYSGTYGGEFSGPLGAVRLMPGKLSTPPVHVAAPGVLYVTSSGVLYICTDGWNWVKVGAQ